MAQFPWLTAIFLLPLVAAAFIPIIPDRDGKTLRWYALGVGPPRLRPDGHHLWPTLQLRRLQFSTD